MIDAQRYGANTAAVADVFAQVARLSRDDIQRLTQIDKDFDFDAWGRAYLPGSPTREHDAILRDADAALTRRLEEVRGAGEALANSDQEQAFYAIAGHALAVGAGEAITPAARSILSQHWLAAVRDAAMDEPSRFPLTRWISPR